MTKNTPVSGITQREIDRMWVLAEIQAGGTLQFNALLRRLTRDPPFQSDVPLAPLLRTLEDEVLSEEAAGIPRRYFTQPAGHVALQAFIRKLRHDLARKIHHTGRLAQRLEDEQGAGWREVTAIGSADATFPVRARGVHRSRGPPPAEDAGTTRTELSCVSERCRRS